jgi:enoyl-CoA hydratase
VPPKKPLIAAIEGYALAGGLEIALACDLIVASEDARFGIPEAKRGLVAGAGGLMRLPRQIPSRIAMELAMTGEFIDARRAYELGLVNRVVAPGTALETARALGRTIAANGPLAVVASKRVMVESQDWPLDELYKNQGDIIDYIFKSEDAVEGATAFTQKRTPNWKGR